jgi:hypothetical protein
MWHCVGIVRPDVLAECVASIFRYERICGQGAALAVSWQTKPLDEGWGGAVSKGLARASGSVLGWSVKGKGYQVSKNLSSLGSGASNSFRAGSVDSV